MSHFIVIVTNTNKVPVDTQLAPFDENRDVPAYDRECYCVGSIARREANKAAAEQYGKSYDDLRSEYWAMPEDDRPDWKEHIRPLAELETKLDFDHEMHNKPDPDCDNCQGKGTYRSQYNPDSKWDWYQTGGRWMGYFKLKEGSEGVLGEPGVGDNKAEPGTADVVHVRDIDFDAMGDDIVPFAILHEGNWLERGEMGWFGMVSNEKDGDAWKEQALKLLKSLEPDSSIEAVDCHI